MIFNVITYISQDIRKRVKSLKNTILYHYLSFFQNTRLFWYAYIFVFPYLLIYQLFIAPNRFPCAKNVNKSNRK